MRVIFWIIIAVILVLFLLIKMKTKRQRIAVLIGLTVSILSFFAFLALIFSVQRAILWSLLLVFYVSLIVFLVLWNTIKTKTVYLILTVPATCILAAITIICYYNYINKIPAISEESNLYRYKLSTESNMLAKLDEEPNLKLIDNLPVLDGATALYPVYASFAQAVYTENKYDTSDIQKDYPENVYTTARAQVLCTTTIGAYDNLSKGEADIIFCAAPSDTQMKQFYDNDINLKLVPIGREAFVFFVNKKNTIDYLTIKNIQDIYSGKINNWKELNGANQKIMAFQRPENSGSQTMLKKVMANIPIMRPRRENVSSGMGDIINQVAVYRNFSNAIGYSFLFYSTEMVKNDQIKLLSIDGIYPSRETIQDGSYPFSDDFYAIFVDSDNKNENIELFIEWMLSGQGQLLVSKTGYIPIKIGEKYE
jgi:phosphate transport system substrate-binding protein